MPSIIDRLQERDARWQAYCDAWKARAETMNASAETIAAFDEIRGTLEAEVIELLEEVAAAVAPLLQYAAVLDEAYPTPHGSELQIVAPISSPYAIGEKKTITIGDLRRLQKVMVKIEQKERHQTADCEIGGAADPG